MRNADKDREIIAMERDLPLVRAVSFHWLERAVSAEQRVAELEETLRAVMRQLESSAAWTDGARAYHVAYKALKGTESEDRP